MVGRAAPPDGGPAGPVGDDATLPSGGLDARSLTFCAPSTHPRVTYQNDFHCNETAEELSGLLDGAVGMLQDLEGNWKDAVRNSIQLGGPAGSEGGTRRAPVRRGLQSDLDGAADGPGRGDAGGGAGGGQESRRLTRSAFTRTLLEREGGAARGGSDHDDASPSSSPAKGRGGTGRRVSVFAVRGLSRLRETFAALDDSVRNLGRDRVADVGGGAVDIIGPDEVRTDGACVFLFAGSVPAGPCPFCFLCFNSHLGLCLCMLALARTHGTCTSRFRN